MLGFATLNPTYALARPFLLKQMGAASLPPQALQLPAAFQKQKPDSRREFLRACLQYDSLGYASVLLYPEQGSAVMSGLVWADGLVDLPAGQTVKEGELVRYLPLVGVLD